MRLIDADKVIQSIDRQIIIARLLLGDDPQYQKFVSITEQSFKQEISNAPTVSAISIEWLNSIMEKQLIFAMESEMEGTTTVQDGVIHCVSGALACQVLANVIELWKKENE